MIGPGSDKNHNCSFPFRCQTLWAHCVTTSKLARMSRWSRPPPPTCSQDHQILLHQARPSPSRALNRTWPHWAPAATWDGGHLPPCRLLLLPALSTDLPAPVISWYNLSELVLGSNPFSICMNCELQIQCCIPVTYSNASIELPSKVQKIKIAWEIWHLFRCDNNKMDFGMC